MYNNHAHIFTNVKNGDQLQQRNFNPKKREALQIGTNPEEAQVTGPVQPVAVIQVDVLNVWLDGGAPQVRCDGPPLQQVWRAKVHGPVRKSYKVKKKKIENLLKVKKKKTWPKVDGPVGNHQVNYYKKMNQV